MEDAVANADNYRAQESVAHCETAWEQRCSSLLGKGSERRRCSGRVLNGE